MEGIKDWKEFQCPSKGDQSNSTGKKETGDRGKSIN